MKYITRELERKFLKMNTIFKALMITGARQVGKSTMLKKLAEHENRTIVSMDNFQERELARTDPRLFFQVHKPPILIDEIQKAPELFETIKIMCDETEENGLFWLTGSESKRLLKEARDSLTGRVCILKMYSLSQREKLGLTALGPIDFTYDSLVERQNSFSKNNIVNVFDAIWRGGMPGTVNMDGEQLMVYYESYVNNYIMRDAVDDNGVLDTTGFNKALRACAAFAGNILNYSDIANAADITVATAKEWIKILQTMGIVYLLEPFSNNELKRLIKKPKVYFCDTGFCAYLSSWTSKDTLMKGAASGHYFENYVVGELFRGFAYSSLKVNISFYRDTNQKEIDLVIEQNGEIFPLEIKMSASPDIRTVKNFHLLAKSSLELTNGGVVCMIDRPFPLDKNNTLIPCNII
ncbi:MAG: ATP-binding protein [Acidaminococcaceae bacterium]|jgi:predicted AAA+ superfamily ATPase|nr:ATP-binding protein [Acidaminococcaceae bacterium]